MDLKTASRRRGAELEDAILDAAWEVLIEAGYHGFTFEAVAARAGTSRPVLYRRWPQREELLMAVLRKHWWSRPIPIPDTGDLRTDIISFLRAANAGRTRLLTFIGAQLMDYFRESGSSFAQLRDALRRPGQPNAMEVILARAVARGELEDVPRSARVMSLPFDLFRNELLMTMRSVSDAAIIAIVDEVWLPLLRATASASGSRSSGSDSAG